MTYEIELIISRLNQSFHVVESYGETINEGSFHGPSLMTAVYSIPYSKIDEKPIKHRHSTREILNHCQYWMEAAVQALTDKCMADIVDVEDWPKHETSLESWKEDIKRINLVHQNLIIQVRQLDKSALSETIQSTFHGNIFKFTNQKMLHGIADHNIYHAGQISLYK